MSLADGSDLGPIGIILCSFILGAQKLEHKFVECKSLLHPFLLGLDFAPEFRVGMDWNSQGQLYLYQDHKPLTYSKANSSQDSTILLTESKEARLINKTNILLPPQTIAVALTKVLTGHAPQEQKTGLQIL